MKQMKKQQLFYYEFDNECDKLYERILAILKISEDASLSCVPTKGFTNEQGMERL